MQWLGFERTEPDIHARVLDGETHGARRSIGK
jgi:hypothetical protein